MSHSSTTPLPQLDASRAGEPALKLDPRTYDRALGCVHCGLCLPACPTYALTQHEADSPRGRIQLMRAMAEGRIDASASVRAHLDFCLDCRACETACPSGVVYHELIEETREKLLTPGDGEPSEHVASDSAPVGSGRLLRWVFLNLMTCPTRLKWALLPARVLQKTGMYALMRRAGLFEHLPDGLRKMEQMLPADGALWPRRLPARTPARQTASANQSKPIRVAFFAGCVGSVLFERVNRMAIELLAASGAEVLVLRDQTCCGAIHHHAGVVEPAREMARRNIDAALSANVDQVVATVAGCGAMLHEYDHLLRDDPAYADKAKAFSAKVCDISQTLANLPLPPMTHPIDASVTYHDACHLAHAQKVTAEPRALLARIPGLRLIPLADCDMCCGAAGTYNLLHPVAAGALARRKLDRIADTGATLCAMGNAGCALHLQSEAASRGQTIRIVHPVELLHQAVFGPSDTSKT